MKCLLSMLIRQKCKIVFMSNSTHRIIDSVDKTFTFVKMYNFNCICSSVIWKTDLSLGNTDLFIRDTCLQESQAVLVLL